MGSISKREIYFSVASIAFGIALVAFVAVSTNQLPNTSLFASQPLSDVSLTRPAKQQLLYGEAKAPIKIVEFSDFSCGFCGRLHPTLKQVVDDSDGQIAWEYRHFPILSELSNDAALASECVSTLGDKGREGFWAYAEIIFANQRSFDAGFLQAQAEQLGISQVDFEACVTSADTIARIENDSAIARSLGARGTPYSVIIFPDGRNVPVSGAVPIEEWNRLLSSL